MRSPLSERIATLRNEYIRLHKKDRVVWHKEGNSNATMEEIMAIHIEDAKTLEDRTSTNKED